MNMMTTYGVIGWERVNNEVSTIYGSLPTKDAHVASRIFHKPMGIYIDLILDLILYYTVSASFI